MMRRLPRSSSFAEFRRDHRYHSAAAVVLHGAKANREDPERFWIGLLTDYGLRSDLVGESIRTVRSELGITLKKFYKKATTSSVVSESDKMDLREIRDRLSPNPPMG